MDVIATPAPAAAAPALAAASAAAPPAGEGSFAAALARAGQPAAPGGANAPIGGRPAPEAAGGLDAATLQGQPPANPSAQRAVAAPALGSGIVPAQSGAAGGVRATAPGSPMAAASPGQPAPDAASAEPASDPQAVLPVAEPASDVETAAELAVAPASQPVPADTAAPQPPPAPGHLVMAQAAAAVPVAVANDAEAPAVTAQAVPQGGDEAGGAPAPAGATSRALGKASEPASSAGATPGFPAKAEALFDPASPPGPAEPGGQQTLRPAAPDAPALDAPPLPAGLERLGLEAPPPASEALQGLTAAASAGAEPATATATTPASAAVPASPPRAAPPAAPARQIAPMVVAVAIGGGTARLSVTLEPVELGRVEVSVERSGDTAQVRILAERPETLALLQRDQPKLDRALTAAGIAPEGRSVSLGLAQGGDGGAAGGRGRQDRQGGSLARGMLSTQAAGAVPEIAPRLRALSLLDLAV